MKAVSLFLLRASTGLLLLVWAMVRLGGTDHAIAISDKYYYGLFSSEMLQYALGAGQALLAVLIIAGLWRAVVLPVQFVVLLLGAAAVWPSLVDPLGLVFGPDNVNILFFPSLIVVMAALVQLAFKDADAIALDRAVFGRKARGNQISGDAASGA